MHLFLAQQNLSMKCFLSCLWFQLTKMALVFVWARCLLLFAVTLLSHIVLKNVCVLFFPQNKILEEYQLSFSVVGTACKGGCVVSLLSFLKYLLCVQSSGLSFLGTKSDNWRDTLHGNKWCVMVGLWMRCWYLLKTLRILIMGKIVMGILNLEYWILLWIVHHVSLI